MAGTDARSPGARASPCCKTPPARAISLHHKPYSIVSYVWGRKYQQSNQWAIETLALVLEPQLRSRE